MNLRLLVALGAAALFVIGGFVAFNEAANALRLAYLWFGFALAASVIAICLSAGPTSR